MEPNRKTLVIINKNAGSYEKAQALAQAFAEHSTLVTFQECDSVERLPEILRQAVSNNIDTIVAGGGDGTIHDTVNAMAPYFDRLRLAIIPLGTGNDLCRSLDIPLDPTEAMHLVLAGADKAEEASLDLIRVKHGELNEHDTICVNVATGGFGGEIEKNIDDTTKERWGALAYARAAISAATNIAEFKLHLTVDAQEVGQTSALNIVIANARTAGGGFEIAPQANPEDRKLDVVITHPANAVQLATIAAQLLVGEYTNSPHVSHFRARKIIIFSNPVMDFTVDGCLWGKTPIEFTIMPSALRVIRPQRRIERGAA